MGVEVNVSDVMLAVSWRLDVCLYLLSFVYLFAVIRVEDRTSEERKGSGSRERGVSKIKSLERDFILTLLITPTPTTSGQFQSRMVQYNEHRCVYKQDFLPLSNAAFSLV